MEKIMQHPIVSQESWLAARKELLVKEKELTRQRDRLSEARRALPWVRISKEYVFDGPEGEVTLAELFKGRSQLVVYHFMFGPGWEVGCSGCSFLADHVEGPFLHLHHHDVSFVAVSRAPYRKIAAFQQRMGWKFAWVSSFGRDFNYDFHVSFTEEEVAKGEGLYNFGLQKINTDELPGVSVFYKDEEGEIFHTYSTYSRGADDLLGAYMFLDLTPLGRNETGPNGDQQDWVRLHDMYIEGPIASSCCHEEKGGKAV
jgi:predicted dithiol-disulfide oxidoreductase (DUF899 family)